jgi:DNA-binding NarL/FixJ family response regulator
VLTELESVYKGRAQLDSSLLEEALTESNYQGLLSPQQHRVMRLMASGMSNAAIGRECGISAKAVERTIAAASTLLDVRTRIRVNKS